MGVSSIGALLFGYDIGVISGVFSTSTFPAYFGMTGSKSDAQQIQGNIVSLLQAGACIGALTANFYAGNVENNSDLKRFARSHYENNHQ